MSDTVNHPSHYTFGGIEVIDAIEAWGLGFHLGNVVKYIARSDHKGAQVEDLKKARWYLDRKIKQMEGSVNGNGTTNGSGGREPSRRGGSQRNQGSRRGSKQRRSKRHS